MSETKKREKLVHNDGEIAHMWLYGTQHEARNRGGNYFYEGDVIYSYGKHFPIARVNRTKKVVLFTTDSYSNTTAGHVSAVKRSIPNEYQIIYVLEPSDWFRTSNVEHIIKKIDAARTKLDTHSRLSAGSIRELMGTIESLQHNLREYHKYFNEKQSAAVKKALAVKAPNDITDEYLADKEKKFNEANEKRQATRLRIENLRYTDPDEYNRIQNEKYQAEQAKIQRRIDAWLDGTAPFDALQHNPTVYLRLKNGYVETSRGVRVPEEGVKRLHDLWKQNPRFIVGAALDPYSVYEADREHVRIGCHDIKREQIMNFVQRNNW